MPPRTLQTKKTKKRKEKMIEPEPQQANGGPTETESSTSVVRPRMGEEGPTGPGPDKAGPSRTRMKEGGPSTPNQQPGMDMDTLVHMMTQVAKNVVYEFIKSTNPHKSRPRKDDTP